MEDCTVCNGTGKIGPRVCGRCVGRVATFADVRWAIWQLANDPATYSENAGRFIIVTEDGEDEVGPGIMDEAEAQSIVDLHNEEIDA